MEKKQVADANFCRGVSARREKASCGCKFLKGSICKIEKEQVVDANFCILTEKCICKGIL